jgi:hypothetical protein
VELARREEQRIKQLNAKRDGVSAASLKHQMRPLRPEDFDPAVAAQQAAIRALNESLGLATALPVPAALAEAPAANKAPPAQRSAANSASNAPTSNAEVAEASRPQLTEAQAPVNVDRSPANDEDMDDDLDALCNLR